MAYTYDINSTHKDTFSSKCLFVCHMLGSILQTFVSTFLIAYIYEFSATTFDYVKNVGVYSLSTYVTFGLTYWLFALLTDKTNRVWIYRLAQAIRLVFVILIIFFGRYLAQMLYLAGAIYGLSEACYYASYNVLKQEMVSRKSMQRFSIFITVASRSMDIIVPITLGALITASTYEQASIYVSVIVAMILALSFGIKSQKPDGSDFNLKEYREKLKVSPVREKIESIYKISIIYGFTSITNQILSVCIMLQFGKALSLGSITSIIAIIAILEVLLVTRFTRPTKRGWVYALAVIFPLFSSLLYVAYPSVVSVIIFNLLSLMAKAIFSTFFDIYRNTTLKESGLYSEISEHQTIIETILAISRVISFGLLICVGLIQNDTLLSAFFVLSAASYSATNLSLYFYEKKYLKILPDGTREISAKTGEQTFQKILKMLKNKKD